MASRKSAKLNPNETRGRKPIEEGFDTVTVGVKMSTRQRDKLKKLGGGPWVRERIDKAKD